VLRKLLSFEDWQFDFIACAMSARSGWAVTVYNTWTQTYQNMIIDGHDCHITIGSYPVIVLDMWEHARRDYLNDRKLYARAMMKEINWNIIEERFKKAEMITKAISGGGQQWT
jgi:Fe-Mn family superoxide dismutase